MQKIIFYAPLGKDTPPDKIGGAEAGCLKTKEIYEHAGYKVSIIDKPATSKGIFRFVIEMGVVPLKLIYFAKKSGKDAIVHIVGFYTKIAAFERLLMNIAHFCGNKVVYEIRNGSMISTYEEGDEKYRRTLRDLLLKPEVVLCQGQEYVDFIKMKWGVDRSYYPNYIMDDFVLPNKTNRPNPMRLIYFGRVTEAKNVNVVLETLAYVRKAGIDATLEIIGGYSEDYKKQLDIIASKNGIAEYTTFYGRKPFEFISKKLRDSHYFIFPSSEKQEGHSNSLTEAMGCGVVPIASTAGFNASICGHQDLIISNINPQDFANRIIEIEAAQKWKYYSDFVYDRILKNYTQSIVSKKLIGYIENCK